VPEEVNDGAKSSYFQGYYASTRNESFIKRLSSAEGDQVFLLARRNLGWAEENIERRRVRQRSL